MTEGGEKTAKAPRRGLPGAETRYRSSVSILEPEVFAILTRARRSLGPPDYYINTGTKILIHIVIIGYKRYNHYIEIKQIILKLCK
jgi:hypothetical protein